MKVLLQISLLFVLFVLPSPSRGEFIAVGSDVFEEIAQDEVLSQNFLESDTPQFRQRFGESHVLKLDEKKLSSLGYYIHRRFNRCGGYTTHETLQEAQNFAQRAKLGTVGNFVDYQINQQEEVTPLVEQVDEINLRRFIQEFSSFENRMHNSETGVAAAKWLRDHWKELTQHRADITVELIDHSRWKQPSVMATIKGASDERVVVGGHLDSVSCLRIPPFSTHKRAPGADDNASGIATITVALRRLACQRGAFPEKTLVIIGDAAEEVGLKGSREIAKKWRKSGVSGAGELPSLI